MSDSTRTFILAADGTLYRHSGAGFPRMVDAPERRRRTRFAGQRVRMAEAIVGVRERAPCAVVRLVCEILGSDGEGRLDQAALVRRNAALSVGRVIPRSAAKESVVLDAGSRFLRPRTASPPSSQRRTAIERGIESK
jgi:hypothetical protein